MSRLLNRVLILSLVAQAFLLCSRACVPPARATAPADYVLVWSDEFTGAALDTTKWGYWRPGSYRRNAIMTRDAVAVSGGQLVITSFTEGGVHYGGMIQTATGVDNPPLIIHDEMTPEGNKYLPLYGYIEARIDFDGSSGMWHSFFLSTTNNLLDAPMDEHERGVELDIVEHKTHQGYPTTIDVSDKAPSALHWMREESPMYPNGEFWHAGGGPHPGVGSLASGFHTYGLEWGPDSLKFYYDYDPVTNPDPVWTVTDAAQPFGACPSEPCFADACPGLTDSVCVVARVPRIAEFLILCSEIPNDSIGYGPLPALPAGFGPLTGTGASTTKMKVDYVRHYQFLPAPNPLTATVASTSAVNLAWTNAAFTEHGYKLERSVNNGGYVVIASLDSNVTTYQDTNLDSNTRYDYRVRSYIGTSYSAYSNTATVTDLAPPNAVTDLALAMGGKFTTAVSWTAPGDYCTHGAVTYDLRRSTSPITAGNFYAATPISTTAHGSGYPECAVATGLSPCTTYYYALVSRDASGNESALSNVISVKTICQANAVAECEAPEEDGVAPATATLSSPSVGKTNLAIAWTAPGDNGSSGTAQEYDLRYSTSSINASNFDSAPRFPICSPQAGGSEECRLIEGLSPSTTYYIALKTRDEWGWSGISNVLSATTTSQNFDAECGAFLRRDPTDDDSRAAATRYEAAVSLSPPGPNPARGTTAFQVSLSAQVRGEPFRVGVFDLAGRRVRSLADRSAIPGPAKIEWNLLDDAGHRVAPAMYMVRVEVGGYRKTFPLVVLR